MAQVEYMTRPDVQAEKNRDEKIKRVCFVCSGNTCRSPMAEAVANHFARQLSESMPEAIRQSFTPTLEAYSAGLYAAEGEPIASNAVLALEEMGITPCPDRDYHLHTARPLPDGDADDYDLLIGMNGGHVMELLLRYPHLATRIVCMPKAISDPYGGDLTRYRECLAEISEGVKTLLFPEALYD